MKTEPTEKEKLIERLEVEISNCQDDLDAASWAYEEGILISKREAVALLGLAKSSPKIKQLEWVEVSSYYLATNEFGFYKIMHNLGSWYLYFNARFILDYANPDEAKVVAQADFEKKVRECLE